MIAKHYIDKLELEPHPEGGYYKQLFGNDNSGKKDLSTIYYLLENEDFSAFHRLSKMIEIWYYHAGEMLNIYVIDTAGNLSVHHLYANGEMQVVIQPGEWFAAEVASHKGFSLVGCAVAPAFDFKNFELGNKKQLQTEFPQHSELFDRLCR